MSTTEVARVPLPTAAGLFEVRAFERGGDVYAALVYGDIDSGSDVLVRLHSECLTGDVLGSLRCDCGVQLRLALRLIAANGSGVLIYATGQEGRGIGLVNKLRAYVAQDEGADTVEANTSLGLPVDSRDYSHAAGVLAEMGIESVRLLTNNPSKVTGLMDSGIVVKEVVPLPTAPHLRNLEYLNTKQRRMDHVQPTGRDLEGRADFPALDATALLGIVTVPQDRPYVVVKAAQTVDGRIATSSGDSKWITGPAERQVTHALRAACDAVMVGIGTILQDDPMLTVRHVPGASPLRVVLDSNLRTPSDAHILDDGAATLIFTSQRADTSTIAGFRSRGVQVEVIETGDGLLPIDEVLRRLRSIGVRSLLVEGGSGVITSMLRSGQADRLIVSIAPTVIGMGTQSVGDLGVGTVGEGIHLSNRSLVTVEDDAIFAWDIGDAAEDSIEGKLSHAAPADIAV